MTSTAGFQLTAGRIPGERIATVSVNADSPDIASGGGETEVMSIDFAAVSGRVYGIRAIGAVRGTGDERAQVRVCEDMVGGTDVNARNAYVQDSSGFGIEFDLYGEYTADATETKTIITSLNIATGTGPINLAAASNRTAFMLVDYISG